jgi:tetratricopeptide (TPR) repeat protein/predicted Ser/Thr protein kinase
MPMNSERSRQIEALYHAAREATADERAALLAQADAELRHEVELLLSNRKGGEPLDRPAMQQAIDLLEDTVALTAGARLGPYCIENKLGAGGMGDVFRAVDTRLGRAVAIKIGQERFNARFEREARAIASLNHPNVCTLYDVGPNYLVMELVQGETLAARLKSGAIAVTTALQYASQIAAALAEAHAKGIVHRDLKPGNIMIANTGVKVLDFGLASLQGDQTLTAERMVMGTPAYMAPEQREARPADARTDIFAFGCVLYEMLTGERAAHPRRRIRTRTLESIVSRCLQEDPGHRWQSAAEVQQALGLVRNRRRGSTADAKPSPHSVARPARTTRIVLGEFENKTGDSVFDGILREGLFVQLQESPFLTLVSDQQVQQVLRFMNRPSETRLTPDVAQEICERTDGSAVLEGSIAGLGSQYILSLRARNCRTGDILGQEQAQARHKEEVLTVLTEIAVRIRSRLGESLSNIREHSTPLEKATTSSLEALKAYSAARTAVFARGFAAAIPHLQRAIAIDPGFAMAHADLGFFCWNMGQTDLGAEYVAKAYQLLDRVSERERLFILFLYDRQVTGNLQKELETLESWAQTYPADFMPWSVLGGWGTQGTGQYQRGIDATEVALRLNPDLTPAYGSLVAHNLGLGRFAEAAATLQRAAERKLESPLFLVSRYYLAFLEGDEAGMKREVDRAHGNLEAEDWMSHNQALVLARSGQMRNARVLWRHTIERTEQTGHRERAAIYRAAQAVCEAHLGNRDLAKENARAALALAQGRDVVYASAFALALAGELSESRRLAEDLAGRFPEDTPVQFEYLPTLRALFALDEQVPSDAVDRLQAALPYDLAMPGTAFFAKFGGLYPAYVRGLAYLAAARGREAAAEFQKVLDHRGIVLADPIGALAHVQLGRALALLGDNDRATRAYEDFLGVWKHADADIPFLNQARAEYAKLSV